MEDTYFIISGSEDGGCSCDQVSKEELLRRITPDEHGECYYGSLGDSKKILNELPDRIDNFTDLVIIKGKIVVPKAKKVIKAYDVD